MTFGIAYFIVYAGMAEKTGKFWRSLFWPWYIGAIIADEAKKRGIIKEEAE